MPISHPICYKTADLTHLQGHLPIIISNFAVDFN